MYLRAAIRVWLDPHLPADLMRCFARQILDRTSFGVRRASRGVDRVRRMRRTDRTRHYRGSPRLFCNYPISVSDCVGEIDYLFTILMFCFRRVLSVGVSILYFEDENAAGSPPSLIVHRRSPVADASGNERFECRFSGCCRGVLCVVDSLQVSRLDPPALGRPRCCSAALVIDGMPLEEREPLRSIGAARFPFVAGEREEPVGEFILKYEQAPVRCPQIFDETFDRNIVGEEILVSGKLRLFLSSRILLVSFQLGGVDPHGEDELGLQFVFDALSDTDNRLGCRGFPRAAVDDDVHGR